MAYYRNICFVEAPQAIVTPFPRYISDCIGVCYLAASVEDIVESMAMPENYYNDRIFESFERLLNERPFDLVAISSMTGGFNNAEKLARIAKKRGITVVMGGFHPTALPEEVLDLGCVDLVVVGEGEATFRELVGKGPSREVRGLVWKENGQFVHTGMRELIRDVDSIRLPLRSIRPERFGEKSEDYTIDTIYTSRGCPWACSFCANDKMHRQWRGRSAENVVEEIALIHDPKKRKLLKIWDANFLTNIRRAERICDLMIERGLTNFRIMTETRARDVIRAERILDKLHRAGLRKVGLGIESPNPETLEKMNKQNTLDDISRAIGLLKKNGMGIDGYFIVGHHSETEADTMVYPGFARSLGLRNALFMAMTPYPGTKIFEEYRSQDNITSYDWDLYNNFCPVVKTEFMSNERLMTMMVYCYVAFFNYQTLLKQERERGMLQIFMRDLCQFVFLTLINRRLGKKEIESTIYGAYECFASTEPRIEYPSGKALKRPVSIFLEESGGRRIEFRITQENDRRVLAIRKVSGTAPVGGLVVSINAVVEATASVSMDVLMRFLYRKELVRNNRSIAPRQYLALAADRDIRRAAAAFYRLYRTCTRKN
ncbi:MAG: B12-binding domain-containing radical SAM protein [Chlorobium sp.]|uniref:B12-binding domain-containing radical SAM protein n=1 Tax=Chlorobium sp. TaxID=1095 RepID=UPI0025BF3272|nr:radical SAM protein [Chlorobium sp.]MCF8384050.1 B12-binding domain-containing radical SAM protein [Chlorobium sp.]